MDNKPSILNGFHVNNWNTLNQTAPGGPEGFPTLNMNGKNVTCVNLPTQSQWPQSYPILNNLLQPEPEPEQTVVPGIKSSFNFPEKTTIKVENTTHNDPCGNNSTSYVNQEHDYNKQNVPGEANNKGNVYLTINLTKYTKGINVNDICGVVLLLKNSSPPVVVNNVNINTPHQTEVDDTVETTPNVSATEPAESLSYKKTVENEDQKNDYFNCPQCEGGFFSKMALKNHLRKNHGELHKKFKCLTCKKSYVSLRHLKRHRKLVHFFHCSYCEDSFEFLVNYKTHLKETHKDVFYRMCKPFFCEDCNDEITGSKNDYLRHLRSHGKIICGVCAEGFPSKKEHKAHMDIHPDEYFCPECKRGFKLKETLKSHEETHNNPYSFICNVCKKGFKTKLMMRNHVSQVHLKKRNYMCERCSKMFRTPQQLLRHQTVVHEGVKNYPCPQCDRSFSSASNCKLHMDVMHLKVKPYQCEYCGKRFARKDYVINHSKVHKKSTRDREAPKVSVKQSLDCGICNKIFASTLTLKHHLKYVHKVIKKKKFKCRHCDLMFLYKKTRMQHEKLHTDPVNKFQCSICWKRMEKKEELEAHLEEHDDLDSFKCDICNKEFSSRVLLEAHVCSEHIKEEEMEKDEREEDVNL